ncbi:MAG: hypothetical protein CNCCGFBP_00026 [Fimbriimonadaceae bacterium]|nr:hypothetical protein [Fimbriimonadaceae bacterium]
MVHLLLSLESGNLDFKRLVQDHEAVASDEIDDAARIRVDQRPVEVQAVEVLPTFEPPNVLFDVLDQAVSVRRIERRRFQFEGPPQHVYELA